MFFEMHCDRISLHLSFVVYVDRCEFVDVVDSGMV